MPLSEIPVSPSRVRRLAQQRYAAGDWFAVPLAERAVAVARIARHNRGIVYAYVFAPPRAEVPALAEVEHHRPDDAATHILVSHLALCDGAWPVLGQSAFDPAEWPVAQLERHVDRVYAVRWDEQTLSADVRARPLDPAEAGHRPPDGLLGTRAAETTLRRLFGLEATRTGPPHIP
jgi:hypothetical protein